MDKFFVLVDSFNNFKNIKLSMDPNNEYYITYEDRTQTYGTPEILWDQIVFVADSSIIYTKGVIYTNYIKPDTGIPITDLDESIFKLSSNYQKSSYTSAQDLALSIGDEYEIAFGKLEKRADETSTYLSNAYTYLINTKQDIIGDLDTIRSYANRVPLITPNQNADWNAESGATYIYNKPDLSIYLTSETQSDWEEDNTTSAAYILNKPTIPTLVKSDWNVSDSTSYAYIQNKPNITQGADSLLISYGGSNIILFKDSGNLSLTSNNNLNFDASGTELSFSSNGAVFLEAGSKTLTISQYDTHLLFNDENIAFQSEAFDGNISLSTNDESAIDSIENGIYRLQYIDIIYEGGEPIGEDIINSAVLVQKTSDNQYMYIDGIVKHRVYTENDGWSEWEQIGGVQSNWNENDTTSAAYILNKPEIPTIPTNLSSFTNDVGYLTTETNPDWNESDTTAAAYILNKPTIPELVKSDWEENDPTSYTYIQNKPDLSNFLTIETKANWNETNSSSAAYIQNKPDLTIYLTSETKSDWEEDDITSAAYIQNKPEIPSLVKSDWNESDSTSYAYILNKPIIPIIPTTSTTVTENDNNPISGGAVYTKFADLIGSAPAALDTLQEIAYALNNDADLAGTLTTQISAKIPKVSNPITGNFAYFNSDGTIADSSYNYNTFLTEHQSLKTVNNESLVGTGNIVVSGLPQVSASDNGKILMVVNGQWQLVSPSVLYSGNGVPNNVNGNNGDLYMQTE